MKAVGSYLICKPLEQTKSAGGIMLPVDTKQRVQRATVLSKGDGVGVNIPLGNPVILYDRDNALEFKNEKGEALVAINFKNVLGYE